MDPYWPVLQNCMNFLTWLALAQPWPGHVRHCMRVEHKHQEPKVCATCPGVVDTEQNSGQPQVKVKVHVTTVQ